MKSIITLLIFAATQTYSASAPVSFDQAPDTIRTLTDGFQNLGNEARPRAYWNWLNGAVTHAALTRDLEEAKAKGLGGLEMWDTEAMQNPGGFVPAGPPFMGPESVASMHHAMKEAKRLGLDLGLITSSGWNAGGPWVSPEMASKNLFVATEVVTGPAQISRKLAFPEVPRDCHSGTANPGTGEICS
ncbi:MAG: glycosyl hydrolase [Verrucomicrobia bacterium]|nr:glycosyl hydrolase [Verrucomicrobiota bacterium]